MLSNKMLVKAIYVQLLLWLLLSHWVTYQCINWSSREAVKSKSLSARFPMLETWLHHLKTWKSNLYLFPHLWIDTNSKAYHRELVENMHVCTKCYYCYYYSVTWRGGKGYTSLPNLKIYITPRELHRGAIFTMILLFCISTSNYLLLEKMELRSIKWKWI